MWLNPSRDRHRSPPCSSASPAPVRRRRAYGRSHARRLVGAARRQLPPDVGLGRTVVGQYDLHNQHVVHASVEVGLHRAEMWAALPKPQWRRPGDRCRAAPGPRRCSRAGGGCRCSSAGAGSGRRTGGPVPFPRSCRARGRRSARGPGAARPEHGAGDSGVLGRHEVGVGAGRPRRRQLEHPWSQGGKDRARSAIGPWREFVEVAAHLGQRRDVLLADQPLVAKTPSPRTNRSPLAARSESVSGPRPRGRRDARC